MRKYLVRYMAGEDLCNEWCYASSKEEAAEKIKDDNWDVDEIVTVEDLGLAD